MELMPAGDVTIIGERGINLSGGQRQRVAIARALYSSANVVIMDDPLSSLDNEVARHIFEQSIRKMLLKANRTVILVTQQLSLVHQADYLIVMKDGRLQAAGSYKDIEAEHPQIVKKWHDLIAKAHEKEQKYKKCIDCNKEYSNIPTQKLTFSPQQARIDTKNSIEINLLKSQLEQSTTNTIDLQKRLNNCEKTVKNLEEENAQLVLSARNEVTTLKQQLNERDKTIDSLKELEDEPELANKESMELKKKLAESDQIIARLKRENTQLKINSRYNCELEKLQISSNIRSSKHLSIDAQLEQSFYNINTEQELHENIVNMLKFMKEGSAQLEQMSKITNELQAQRFESNQKFEFLKTVNAQLEKHLSESNKTVEFLRQANIQIELQERLGRLEKIIMEQPQEINEAKKHNFTTIQSVPSAAADNATTNTNLTQYMLKNQKEPSTHMNANNSLYEPADDQYSVANDNEMALKNQIIDLEQKLRDTSLELEKEKQSSKILSVQHNKLQKYLIATNMSDTTRDLAREHRNVWQANISNSATLADEMKNQPPNHANNDNE